MNQFIKELSRRNVFRVAIVYAVVAWLILQMADVLLDNFGVPEWGFPFVTILLMLGFPIALIFAWAFEITPEGIRKEKDVDRSQSITHKTGRKIDFLIIGLLTMAVAYFAFDNFVLRHDTMDGPAVAEAGDGVEKSIAVLPFVDMSPEGDQEYFSDGISEQLLNVLVRVEGLRVASRTSSFAFKDTNRRIPEIAAELGVDHILEGSVRKAGQRVRITAQLIDVSDDRHLWSDSYDRELADIFAVQDEIATAIVEALKVVLGAETAITTASTGNADAYNEYLRGRYFWNRRSVADFETAIEHYEKAIELDPNYARAWSALAETLVLMPEYGEAAIDEISGEVETTISQALALDPESAEAYTARAYFRERFQRRWRDADRDYRKAIQLDPKYATAWQWYAESEQQTGVSGDFGLAKARKAFELDPASPIINMVLGDSLKQSGHYEEALEHYRVSLSMLPDLIWAWSSMGDTYLLMGRLDDALSAYQRGAALQRSGDGPGAGLWEPETYELFIAALADPTQRETAVTHINALMVERPDALMWKASMLAALGAVEPTLDALEASYEAGYIYLPYIVHDPLFPGSVRDHPRFLALVEKLNMTEYLP